MCLNMLAHIHKVNVINEQMENDIIKYLDENPNLFISFEQLGLTEEDVNNADNYVRVSDDENPTPDFKLAKSKVIKLYRYISDSYGSSYVGANTRPFCEQMVKRTKLAMMPMDSITKLNSSNKGFGIGGSDTYSIFNWRGGVNCKHYWVKYLYQTDTKNLVKAPESEQPIQQDKGAVPHYKKK